MTGATSGAGTVYPSGAPEFTPFFSGVCVTRSLVLSVCFVDRYLSFCTFSFDHCVVYSSSIYRFWLPLGLWYLQTLLPTDNHNLSHCLYKVRYHTNAISLLENVPLYSKGFRINIQSNLPMWSPLLSSHLYWKVTFLLSCHRKFHMNWTSFKRSPVLNDHFLFVSKVTS